MSISTPIPPAPPRKRGLGCLGCGCLVLVVLGILFVGLVAGACYLGYTKVLAYTETTPASIPSPQEGDDVFASARQKISDFDHDVKNHQPAKMTLTADEINAMIARNPDLAKNKVRAFVTMTGDQGRVQASLPTDGVSHGLLTGRYANMDMSFELHFDPQTKSVNAIFDALQIGDQTLTAPPSGNGNQTAFNQSFMRSFTPAFNQSFNAAIRKYPDGAALLDQAKTIEIQNGSLTIETQ
jgi:hypothetical protein